MVAKVTTKQLMAYAVENMQARTMIRDLEKQMKVKISGVDRVEIAEAYRLIKKDMRERGLLREEAENAI